METLPAQIHYKLAFYEPPTNKMNTMREHTHQHRDSNHLKRLNQLLVVAFTQTKQSSTNQLAGHTNKDQERDAMR